MCIYICACVCVHIYMYIYIHNSYICIHVYTYIYIYIYICPSLRVDTTNPPRPPSRRGATTNPPPLDRVTGHPSSLDPYGTLGVPQPGGVLHRGPRYLHHSFLFSSLCENLHLQRWGKPQGLNFSRKYMSSFFGHISNLIHINSAVTHLASAPYNLACTKLIQRAPTWHPIY